MTDRCVIHSTFSLERVYPASPARVFAAWTDPAAKARWFSPNGPHKLDFRVGGREVNHARGPGGQDVSFESHYHEHRRRPAHRLHLHPLRRRHRGHRVAHYRRAHA